MDSRPDTTASTRSDARERSSDKSIVITLAALWSISLALVLSVILRQVDDTRQLIDTQATEIAATAAELARFEVAANDRVALAFRLEAFTRFSGVKAMVIMDRREQPLAAVLRNPAGNLSASPGSTIALERMGQDLSPGRGLFSGKDTFVVRAAIGEIAPIGWVYLEHDDSWFAAARRTLVLTALGATLLLATALMMLWRIRRAR